MNKKKKHRTYRTGAKNEQGRRVKKKILKIYYTPTTLTNKIYLQRWLSRIRISTRFSFVYRFSSNNYNLHIMVIRKFEILTSVKLYIVRHRTDVIRTRGFTKITINNIFEGRGVITENKIIANFSFEQCSSYKSGS